MERNRTTRIRSIGRLGRRRACSWLSSRSSPRAAMPAAGRPRRRRPQRRATAAPGDEGARNRRQPASRSRWPRMPSLGAYVDGKDGHVPVRLHEGRRAARAPALASAPINWPPLTVASATDVSRRRPA